MVLLLRVGVVVLVLSAEIYLIAALSDHFTPWNHYSYFTILSNIFAAVVLGMGAFRPIPDGVRGAAVTYMATTGVVYALLLRGVDVDTPSYANWALHVIVPVLVVADWALDPPAARLGRTAVLTWLIFPVLYLAYTLLRGPVVDWYPYPFLDPREPGGYATVAVMSVGVATAVAAMAWVVARSGRKLGARDRITSPKEESSREGALEP